MSAPQHAGFALALALLLAGALLSLPVHYRFALRWGETFRWHFRAGFYQKAGPAPGKKKTRRPAAARKGDVLGFLPGAARRLAGRSLGKVKVQRVRVRLRLGIAEAPDTTALAVGTLDTLLCALLSPAVPAGNVRLSLCPVFDADCLQGEAECIFWIRAWHIIGIAINLVKEYLQWRTNPSKTSSKKPCSPSPKWWT